MNKMDIWITTFALSLFFTQSSKALSTVDLSHYQAPTNLENIHVERLSSSKTASEFIIFIRKEVKAHYHKEHTELVYVLEGEAIFWLGETKQTIKAGDFIRINENVVHTVKVTSAIPLKVLSIQTPEFTGKDRILVDEKLL